MECQDRNLRVEKGHTESVKTGKVTGQWLGAGNLGIDGRNGGGRATDERCTSIDGSEIARRQGNGSSINSDPCHRNTGEKRLRGER